MAFAIASGLVSGFGMFTTAGNDMFATTVVPGDAIAATSARADMHACCVA